MEYENIEPSSANVKIEPVNINLKNYSNCDCLGSFLRSHTSRYFG